MNMPYGKSAVLEFLCPGFLFARPEEATLAEVNISYGDELQALVVSPSHIGLPGLQFQGN